MNSRNASGNTPLHVCAVNNQESCARQLLFRGADRQALNYANQTPYQVAVIAGNMELADIIQNYKQDDVGESNFHVLIPHFHLNRTQKHGHASFIRIFFVRLRLFASLPAALCKNNTYKWIKLKLPELQTFAYENCKYYFLKLPRRALSVYTEIIQMHVPPRHVVFHTN